MKRVRCFISYTPGGGDELERFLGQFVEDGAVSNKRFRELVVLGVLAWRQGARIVLNDHGEKELAYMFNAAAREAAMPVQTPIRGHALATPPGVVPGPLRGQPQVYAARQVEARRDEPVAPARTDHVAHQPSSKSERSAPKTTGKPVNADIEPVAGVKVAPPGKVGSPPKNASAVEAPADGEVANAESGDSAPSDHELEQFLGLLDGLVPPGSVMDMP